jgi:hypothetical protein
MCSTNLQKVSFQENCQDAAKNDSYEFLLSLEKFKQESILPGFHLHFT